MVLKTEGKHWDGRAWCVTVSKRSTATEHAESEEIATRPLHAKRGTATEHAKRRNASSMPAQGGGKGDRRVKAKVEAHDESGTATEHAKQPQRGTATEHAEQRRSVTLKYNVQTQLNIEEAQADRADDSIEHLAFTLAEFLTYLLQNLCYSEPNFLHLEADCEDIVFEKIAEWAQTDAEVPVYMSDSLLLHKKMWDRMTRDKCGVPKDHSFVDWCKRIAMCSTGSTAASSAADDGAFRKLAKDFLTHDLTPEQKNDPVYRFREDKSVTTKQRSTINNVLRKNLGDHRVAYYIFEHGVPTLLDPPLQRKLPDCYKALLQNMLEEFMMWHASLLRWLLARQKDPNTIIAQRLSDLDQKEWQTQRRRKKHEAQQRLSQGTRLAKLRDSGDKEFDDMSATEQQILEDFDCKRSQKLHEELRIKKPDHVRR